MFSIAMLLSIVLGFLFLLVSKAIMNKTNKLFSIATFATGICMIICYLLNSEQTPLLCAIIVGLMTTFAMCVCGSTYAVMSAAVASYGELKTGKRTEGLASAATNIGMKIGLALGNAIFGFITAAGGYIAGSDTQTEAAITALKNSYLLIPAIFAFIAGILFLILWHPEKDMKKLQAS